MTLATATLSPARQTRLDGRELRGRETRHSLIQAVRDMADCGIYLAPVEVVAERAGRSVRAVFQHFSSMAELRAVALTDAHIAKIDARLQKLSPRERVRAWLSGRLPT